MMMIKTLTLANLLPLLILAQDLPEIGSETRDGKLMYEAWCARCHGDDGSGKVEGIELDTPVPDFADCSFTSREPRKDWLAVIMHGGPARGLSMTMPAWGEAISEEQAEAIISHIKTFCRDEGWPQGDLNFRRAHVTSKAFPENEALLIPTFTRDSTSISQTKFVYESRLGPVGQWEISIPFTARFSDPRQAGLGDIELAGKYTMYHDVPSMSIASIGVEVAIPSGSTTNGLGSGVWKFSPFLAAAKAIGWTYVQTSLKIEQPLHAGLHGELFYNLAWTVPLTSEKKGFFPMIEFNGVSSLGGNEHTLFLTPQLYVGLVKRGHIAVSVGAQMPIAGDRPFEYRIVSFLLWEYADGGLW